jgi:DNA topoisomerase IA
MKTQKELEQDLDEIENSNIPLDQYMRGYVNALRYVLEVTK